MIREWLKKEGDLVTQGEVIAVIESEKFTEEIEARQNGTLRKIFVNEGGETTRGTPIGMVAEPQEALPKIRIQPATAKRATEVGRKPAEHRPERDLDTRPRLSRRPMSGRNKRGLDISWIWGTGPQGSVTRSDVKAYLAEKQPIRGEPALVGTVVETRELSSLRRIIAAILGRSYREAVHVTLTKKVDVSNPMKACEQLNRGQAADLSIVDFIIMALVKALDRRPEFNAVFGDGRHKVIREKNVGQATDIQKGLVTPVLRRADEKDIFEIAKDRKELTEKARAGQCGQDDLAGSTFTVTDLGPHGIDSFAPVTNPPEIAMLGIGRIQDEAVRGERDSLHFKPLITFSLTFDQEPWTGGRGRFFGDLGGLPLETGRRPV